MINGHLSEAHQGFALPGDVDKETFVRFVRWIYSKDYPALQHKIVSKESMRGNAAGEVVKTDESVEDDWGIWGTKSKKDKKSKRKEAKEGSLKEAFVGRKYDLDAGWEYVSMPAPRSNKASVEDYTEVFLCHARLYVFAEKYDIQPLKKLALSKLQQTLAIYTLFPERVGDVTSLLKYVYANTSESKPDVEDIRTMLAHYIGCEMETLVRDGEIKELLASNEEMLNDFLNMFAQRIP